MKTTQKSFIHDGNSSFSCSTVNIGFHASTCSKVVFKVAWILKQNFKAILWQYWWTIFLKKAILAPSHSKHVINMCRCDQGRRKKKTFLNWNEYSLKMLFSFSTIRRKKMVRKCAYFLSPYWACRHFREQLIKSCQTLTTKFSSGEHKNNNHILYFMNTVDN